MSRSKYTFSLDLTPSSGGFQVRLEDHDALMEISLVKQRIAYKVGYGQSMLGLPDNSLLDKLVTRAFLEHERKSRVANLREAANILRRKFGEKDSRQHAEGLEDYAKDIEEGTVK